MHEYDIELLHHTSKTMESKFHCNAFKSDIELIKINFGMGAHKKGIMEKYDDKMMDHGRGNENALIKKK